MNAISQNQVQLLGHLGQDVELRDLGQGKKLARLSLATNEFKQTASGMPEKITTWHNLIAWGNLAEEMNTNLQKGQKVFIEGKIQYRTYETKAGEKRYASEIQVTSFKKIAKEESAPANPL
jgi:single-strand DNA-binding protein